MSENYGKCKRCVGRGTLREVGTMRDVPCPSCDESGFSGDATDFMQKEQDIQDSLDNREIKNWRN